jgi:hypothetical protein
VKWAAKKDRDGNPIPHCWITDSGYTVAECRIPECRYTITRPGGDLPFAYTPDKGEVVRLIAADKEVCA